MSDEIRKVSKTALNKCFWYWAFFAHACYNYERLQGTGFLHSMCPIIDELYDKDDKEGRAAAMTRHAAFFNTEPRVGTAIIGLTAAMEERIASGEEGLAETVTSVKTGLMGPLAGIGDTLMQAILAPLLLSIAIGIGEGGNVMGPVLYFAAFVAIVIVLHRLFFNIGYNQGDEGIAQLLESGAINKVIVGAGIMGCTVMGALAANYVKLDATVVIPLTTGEFNLQENFFNAIMPKILPLGLTLLVWWLMDKKGVSSTKMLVVIVAIGAVLGAIGII